jgi:hypothetical protein
MKHKKFKQQPATRFEMNQDTILDSSKPVPFGYGSGEYPDHNPDMFPMCRKSILCRIEKFLEKTNDGYIISGKEASRTVEKEGIQDTQQKSCDDLPKCNAKEIAINKEFGTVASGGFTPTFNMGDRKEIKDMAEIAEEATPHEPKTKLQEKVLGKIKYFEKKSLQVNIGQLVKDIEKNINNEVMIDHFIRGYEKLALLSKQMPDSEVEELFNLAKEVNILKSYNIEEPAELDRLEHVIFSDSVAHYLHQVKFHDGSSLYKKLDELADISKSFGETDRDTRLLILEDPAENIKKLQDLSHMEILHKGKLLEKSLSFWRLFEKSIKSGVEKLSNSELVILREWLFSKV